MSVPTKAEWSKPLKRCTREHGHKGNSATVYGHPGSDRICIRLHASNVWIYDPRWENR